MTEKRFKNNGTLIFDNKTPLNTFEVVDKLNELHEENEQLKNNIREAYQTERTMIGKSVLKQLIDKME